MLKVIKGETMDLPQSKHRQEYADEIKVIEANIKDISNGTAPAELYDYTQNKLDQLASRFQNDEQLGASRYKLYELQALLYYFQNRDADAHAFIQHAIEVHGSSYAKAEKLEALIEERSDIGAEMTWGNELPLELQSLIKSLHTSAIIMVVISIISVYFIPWAIFYIILATKLNPKKLPSRTLVMWAGILSLPLCLGVIPIIITVEFWRMHGKLKEYEELGAKAFKSDQEWLEGEPKRKRSRKIATTILLSIVGIFMLLILIAIFAGQ